MHLQHQMKASDIDSLSNQWAAKLRARGMRRTKSLDLLIAQLIRSQKPITIAELAQLPALANQCDPATIYRLLMKLEEHGMVRRLGLHERSTYFIPVLTDHHHDYLICTGCGSIQEVAMACPVSTLERKLEKQTGFRHIYHELEFFGICINCHDERQEDGRTHCCHH